MLRLKQKLEQVRAELTVVKTEQSIDVQRSSAHYKRSRSGCFPILDVIWRIDSLMQYEIPSARILPVRK